MRTVRRLCFAVAAVLATAAFVLPSGARADVAAPLQIGAAPQGAIYDGVGAAAAVHEQFDAVGGVAATSEPQYDSLPDAFTVFNSDRPVARASTYYPGATIASLGPGVLCGQVIEPNFGPLAAPCADIPPFPTVAQVPTGSGATDASTPTTQRLATGPIQFTATAATAHADHRYADANATDGAFETAGAGSSASAVLAFRRAAALATSGPVAAAAVQPQASDNAVASDSSSSAVSHQEFDSSGNLVVTATSVVKGVSLMGGAVKISSITATSTYVTNGSTVKRHSQSVTVTGATAGGMPATIDQNGITVNGSNAGKPAVTAVNSALQQLLAATSTTVRLLTPSTSSKPGQVPAGLDSGALGAACTNGEADGVQLFQVLDASKVPQGQVFFMSATFGSACSDATVMLNAANANVVPAVPSVGSPPLPASSTADLGPTAGFSPPVGGSEPSALGSVGGVPSSSVGSSGPIPARSGGGGLLPRLEADLAGHGITGRFSLLYLAFVVAFAGLALGVLPFLRPRLPHTR